MSVDMYERRFRQELLKLPRFTPNDQRDPRVWRVGFPAWRALFSSLCLYGHSTGYRLPSFESFYGYCKGAYTHEQNPNRLRFGKYFEEDLLPGMRQRVSAWYESGMTEMHLHACLVEAIEDKSKCGLVLYDPRADWKLKADVIVAIKKQTLRISAYAGDSSDRPQVESRRDAMERDRKKNTSESAHWENEELARMPLFEIAKTSKADAQIVNGLRLFSLSAVNQLLESIYLQSGVKNGYFFSTT